MKKICFVVLLFCVNAVYGEWRFNYSPSPMNVECGKLGYKGSKDAIGNHRHSGFSTEQECKQHREKLDGKTIKVSGYNCTLKIECTPCERYSSSGSSDNSSGNSGGNPNTSLEAVTRNYRPIVVNTNIDFDAKYNQNGNNDLLFANNVKKPAGNTVPAVSSNSSTQQETDARNNLKNYMQNRTQAKTNDVQKNEGYMDRDFVMNPQKSETRLETYDEFKANQRQETVNSEYFLYQGLRNDRRKRDSIRYETQTPWYDKKIDRYSQGEVSTLEVGAAYAAKGGVILYDFVTYEAGKGIVEGGQVLLTGQAKKELKEMTNILLKETGRKADFDAGMGYADALKKYHPVFIKNGGKLTADAIGNENAIKNYLGNQDKQNEKLLETRDKHLESKGFITPQTVRDVASQPQKEMNNVINKERDRYMRKAAHLTENGNDKQLITSVIGIERRGNSTLFGFQNYILERDINTKR